VSLPERNLILVHSQGWQDRADFLAIKAQVERLAPDVAVFVVSNDIRSSVTRKQAGGRPTLIFSPVRLLEFRPLRGTLYAGAPMSKIDEMRALAAAGLPVPRFEVIGPATRLSAADYGPLVVIKPTYALASWGQGVELRRTGTVRYRAPEEFPDWHPGRHAPMVAQRFIDCGYPMTCRVLTIFGQPIFTYCRESTRPLALPADKHEFEQREYMPSPPDRRAFVTRDPAMLALAARAYRAMPQAALQACDILRGKDGELHLLEVNPGGGTWMFSSPGAQGYKEVLGIDDLSVEFDAFRVIAQALVERTRAEAI
jgi:hypothetical protein